jgi:GNAT superfamily N-acetyltransferase
VGWLTTTDVGKFLAVAGDFLRSQAVENTMLLSVAEDGRVNAATVMADTGAGRTTGAGTPGGAPGHAGTAGPDSTLFGWWCPDDAPGAAAGSDTRPAVTGAFVHTAGRPLVLSVMSAAVAAGLAEDLAGTGRPVAGVNGPPEAATSFAARWRAASRAGIVSQVHRHMRLFRLAGLTPPAPPPGRARTATASDRALLIEWADAFAREVGDIGAPGREAAVDDRLAFGGFLLWESAGQPVSLAGVSRAVAGTVRVGPVYTPPELRGAGYAGALTAAVSRAALEAGAAEVVLFTDLDNPTSNALYQRIGYRPVSDRIVLSFAPAARDGAGSAVRARRL